MRHYAASRHYSHEFHLGLVTVWRAYTPLYSTLYYGTQYDKTIFLFKVQRVASKKKRLGGAAIKPTVLSIPCKYVLVQHLPAYCMIFPPRLLPRQIVILFLSPHTVRIPGIEITSGYFVMHSCSLRVHVTMFAPTKFKLICTHT